MDFYKNNKKCHNKDKRVIVGRYCFYFDKMQ